MAVSLINGRLAVFVAVVLAGVVAFTNLAAAQAGPFSSLAGSWDGSGSIALGGANERIRCRAEYQPGNAGSTVALTLRCASDSYKFELQGNVRYEHGEVRGDWSERTRSTGGRIEGSVKGDQIHVRVDGQSFTALLSLTTKGQKQSISIRTPDGSWMQEANITLNRKG